MKDHAEDNETLTSEQRKLLSRHVSIDGDGNVVGNDNTVEVTKQQAGDYAIQIGEQQFTVTVSKVRSLLNIQNSQVGIIGDHAHIEGGFHFHTQVPPTSTPWQNSQLPDQLHRLVQLKLDRFLARSAQISPQLHPRRSIQDELEEFARSEENGTFLLIGDGGTGKSSLLYHLARWAVDSKTPLMYLDAEKQQLQNIDWLATAIGCKVTSLHTFPKDYELHFGVSLLILIDTMDQLVGPQGIASNIESLLIHWTKSTRMICASRPVQAEKLKDLLSPTIVKVIPKLTETEIRTVTERMGKQLIEDEQILELISVPIYLYLWLETGSRFPSGVISLWMAYWNEVIYENLAKPRDWGNFTRSEFALAKADLIRWLVLQMFQQGSYQVSHQQMAPKLLDKHIYAVAYDALLRAGTISESGGPGPAVIRFFHQSFFEFAVGRRILSLNHSQAKQAIDELIDRVDEPFCRPIIESFVYLAHKERPELEDYLYHKLIILLGSTKAEMMMAQKEGRINLPLASSVSWGIDYIFQDLVDHWGGRMCATLDSGNPDCLEDGEVASTIGSVFERNPRPFAVPYLIASMCKYNKRGRFIGALGKIGTEDARFALLDFTQEQIACPNDQFVFRYLAPALEEACGEEAIPLLKAIRDGGFGDTAETAACRALMDLSQEGSQIDYEIEHILTSLRCVDEEGRPSDWQIVADMASWLRNYGLEKQLVQDNLERITSALEKAINHMHDGARKPVASTLGELGNSHTFDLLSKHLVEGVEPSQEVVEKILLALIRLAERGQISSRITTGVIKGRFSHVRLQYPSLTREVNLFEREILEYLKEKKRG